MTVDGRRAAMRAAVVFVVLLVVLAFACKSPGSKGLDEACESDKFCADGLVCTDGFRSHKVCMQPCGKSAMESSTMQPEAEGGSCPKGWTCSAIVEQRLVDKHTGEHRGSAFGGLADRPMCVPEGWKPGLR